MVICTYNLTYWLSSGHVVKTDVIYFGISGCCTGSLGLHFASVCGTMFMQVHSDLVATVLSIG